MAEYIEREAVIADIEKRYCKPCEAEGKDYNHIKCRACWVDDMVGEIENAPTADVVPAVHGRWVNEQMIVGGFAETWACDCSVCGRTQREPLWKPNYCPNCGARMDGE